MPISTIDLDGLEATNIWGAIKEKIYGVESLKLNNDELINDIQYQQYRLIVKSPKADVNELFNYISEDIGSIYNTDYGKFSFEKQLNQGNITKGDYIRINPSRIGLADIFVKVVGVNVERNKDNQVSSFDLQFRTLEGHVEVGSINFFAKSMQNENGISFFHYMIESMSQINPEIAQTIDVLSNTIRNDQIDNWSQTLANILSYIGGEKLEASAFIETYDNDLLYKDFKIIKNDEFSIGSPINHPKKIEQIKLPLSSPNWGH